MWPPEIFAEKGDVNLDEMVTAQDLDLLIDHVVGVEVLAGEALTNADVNGDGTIDVADVVALSLILSVVTFVSSTSPLFGEQGVASTRETILQFSGPLDTMTVHAGSIFAEFGGQLLTGRLHLSPDRRTVTLFYDQPLPANARVRVTIEGSILINSHGLEVDADDDGEPGGTGFIEFETLTLTPLAGTGVAGRVFASELRTIDMGTTITTVNVPLEGVTISVDGKETELFAMTDAEGNFLLDPAPPGRFFVHIDGRTASIGVPPGAYYPFVGKAFESVAGRVTNIGNVYLPLVAPGTLQPVSEDTPTTITFPDSVLTDFPEFAGTTIVVPPDSLFADDGTRGGMVGISPVPPDRLPGQLPEGLEFPLVITVQTDGATNFDVPVPICFPNLPDPVTGAPLAVGEKSSLYSFNHDKGIWEAVGSMTVNDDGTMVCTDPGVGILAPGWHGTGPSPFGPPPSVPPTLSREPSNATLIQPKAGSFSCALQKQAICGQVYGNALNSCERGATINAMVACTLSALAGEPVGATACGILVGFPYYECLATERITYNDCIRSAQENCGLAAVKGFAPIAGDTESQGFSLQSALQIPPRLVEIGTEIADLINPFVIAGQQVPQEVLDDIVALIDEANSIAGGDAEQFLTDAIIESENQLFPEYLNEFLPRGNAPAYPIRYLATVQRPEGMLALRGKTLPFAQYSLFVPRDGTLHNVLFYDPLTDSYGFVRPFLSPMAPFPVPNVYLSPASELSDGDGDGLGDLVEAILGTDHTNPDSDGDGIPDGIEVANGTNPLDGMPVVMGIIAIAETPGTAQDVFAFDELVVVADGEAGVSVFNVYNGMSPTIIAQIDTPGDARQVARFGDLIAVADGPEGLAVIDISDPLAAGIVRQVSFVPFDANAAATAVAVIGETAYVGYTDTTQFCAGGLVAVDMISGTITAILPGQPCVFDVVASGEFVYVLSPGRFQAVSIASGGIEPMGRAGLVSSTVPGKRRAFVGGGMAYAAFGTGYSSISLADPAKPTLIASAIDQQFGWHQIVDNGSGLGVAVAGPNTADGDLQLYDLADPTATVPQFITAFVTPRRTVALSLYNGQAYAADLDDGLLVINYQAFDNLGVAPAVDLSVISNFSPGRAEAGKLLKIRANATDDVQVRNVEFFVDGLKTVTDGNFEFEFAMTVPPAGSQPSLTIQARATDTGGNTTLSPELTLEILADATPPVVIATTPRNDTISATNEVTEITATFDRAMDPSTLGEGTFRLFSAGPDGVAGNGDDVQVAGGTVSIRSANIEAVLTFAAPLSEDAYQAIVDASVADASGNPLVEAVSWTFSITEPVRWVTDADGSWLIAANWDTGLVPIETDIAILDVPSDVTVNFGGMDSSVYSFTSEERIAINGRILAVVAGAELNGDLELPGGMLSFGEDVTVRGTLSLGEEFARGTLRGTAPDAAARLIAEGGIEFTGIGVVDNATLENPGLAVMSGRGALQMTGGGTFVNLPGAVVDIQNDPRIIVGGTPAVTPAGPFVNQGRLVKSGGMGEALFEFGVAFNNDGSVEVRSGTLSIQGGGTGAGSYDVADGATLILGSVVPVVLESGSSLTGAGAVELGAEVAGTVNLTGETTLAGAKFTQGASLVSLGQSITIDVGGAEFDTGEGVTLPNLTLTRNGLLDGSDDLTVTGPVVWITGTIRGTGRFTSLGPLTIGTEMNGGMQLEGRTFDNAGDAVWSGPAFLSFLDDQSGASETPAVFNNLQGATFEIRNDLTISWVGFGSVRPMFNNAGTLRKTAGAGETRIQPAFANTGTVDIQAGSIDFAGGFTQTDGSTLLSGGNMAAAFAIVDIQGGSLSGVGEIIAPTISNAGEFAPGAPVGVLVLTGDYAQGPQGALSVELGGPNPGIDFDQLVISGEAALDGTLQVTLLDGFAPAVGTTFEIARFASRVGTFASENGLTIAPDRRFQVVYSADAVTLEVVATGQ